MPQKIKKQIKRSMPWLMLFSLLFSTVAAGLFFNLDLKIDKMNREMNWKLFQPEVQAQDDTATTTVTVRNAPPEFSVQPAENPTSTSTTPINVGGVIGFNATANDPENNSYYLIVCSSNSVTAGVGGGAPTCGVTTFCTSGLTSDETQASCTYSNVVDPGAETRQWYAFACDNHASQAECTDASQGSNPGDAAASSPFYVNHAPTFTAVNTTDNNKDPGGSFIVTASASDADVMRGSEILHVYLCNTDSWATSTGCTVSQLCHATSTSPDVSCTFATTTPAIDGNWTYYAFVMDDFYMPAPQNSRSNTYHVNNVAPTVTGVVINGSTNIQLNLKGAAEVSATTSSTSVVDNNGCTDIVDATSTIYWVNISGAYNCTADDSNCYQIAAAACSPVGGTCTGSSDLNITYICTTDIAFHALPTDLSSYAASTTNWLGAIGAYDEALFGMGTSTVGVDVITNTALTVTELQIAYGNLRAGENVGSSTATTTIINYGNSPLNTDLIGTDMLKGADFILAPNQEWGLNYRFDWGTGTNLSSTTPANANVDIARPTNQTDVSDYLYWGIGIPVLTPSGDYEGTNTFTATIDDFGDWNLP